MSETARWLDAREPAPPPELRMALDSALNAVRSADGLLPGSVLEALTASTEDCLDASLSRPGRVRESAFSLLTADALLTYACEAALETPDPDAALRALVPRLLEAIPER